MQTPDKLIESVICFIGTLLRSIHYFKKYFNAMNAEIQLKSVYVRMHSWLLHLQ